LGRACTCGACRAGIAPWARQGLAALPRRSRWPPNPDRRKGGGRYPIERVYIERLGVGPGWRCLELGSGKGSIAKTLAELVGPNGHVVASDIDIGYMAELKTPRLEVRRIDVLKDEIEAGFYDFVVARALLHHLPLARNALERMVAAVKPGGAFLSIEPDMLPATVAEPKSMRLFWQAWLRWSENSGIDYFIGRKMPAWLDSLGLQGVGGEGHTAHFNGGSDWATYWTSTLSELVAHEIRLDDAAHA